MKPRTIIFIITFVVFVLLEMGATIGVYFYLSTNNNNNIHSTMISIGNHVMTELDNIIDTCKYELARTTAFMRHNGIYLSTDVYEDMMQFNKSTILDAIQYYVLVTKLDYDNVTTYEDFCSNNVRPDCTISQIDNNTIVPVLDEPPRPYYWPIIFFGNVSDVMLEFTGLDLYSNNQTKMIVDTALTPNDYTSWSRLSTLVSENPSNYDVILTQLALIDINGPNTIDNTNGVAFIIINVGTVFDTAYTRVITSVDVSNVDIFVFDASPDVPPDQNLLYKRNIDSYAHILEPYDIVSAPNILEYNYTFANKDWMIYFNFLPSFYQLRTDPQVNIIPIVMGVIFVLVDIIIAIMYRVYILMIKQLKSKLEKNSVAKNMLDYVNHEIRNPLNVIKGLVAYVLDRLDPFKNTKKVPDKQLLSTIISDLSTVNGACDMLEHIVTDILDIRKLESGKLDLDNKNISIDVFIQDIKKTISQKINEKQTIALECKYPKKLRIHIDPYRLKQIMLNYLTNAIKYTDSGSITISVKKKANMLRFSVIDTGKGIREENKSKIFQPFNQLSSHDATRYGGIGLGLYLCNMLAIRMQGLVGFESEYDKGSTFWVEFPIELLTVTNSDESPPPV
jgi:signal transduction histidine kinase